MKTNKQSLLKEELYPEFKESFRKMTDEQLLDALEKDKIKPGWVRARGYFLDYLHEEIEKRGLI